MATEIERLLLRLEVTQARFERDMRKANQTANRSAYRIEQRFKQMNSRVGASLRGLAAPLAAAFTVDGARGLIDESTRIENALKVAGLAGKDLTAVYDQLYASAQRNAAPVSALVELYSRAALVQKELGVSQQELINFTDKIAVALRVSGKSAAESSGALLQLSQALGSGVVRAEEFNSVLEGALPVAQAAAAGLEEAGGSVAKLRQLVIAGKVSSEAFFRAFEAGAVILEEKVANATLTFDQRLTQLNNTFINTAGEVDKATGATDFFGKELQKFAEDVQNVVAEIQELIAWTQRLGEAWAVLDFSSIDALKKSLSDAKTIIRNGGLAGDQSNFGAKQDRDPINAGTVTPAKVETVSLSDFSAPSKKKGTAKKPKQAKERSLDDFQREVQLITERTRALEFEQSVVGRSAQEIDKARAAQDLLNAAREAGIPLTAQMSQLIDQLSSRYAEEAAELERMEQKQQEVNDRIKAFGDDAKSVFSGVLQDIRQGSSAIDIMRNAVDRLVQSLSNRALDSLFDGLFSGGSTSPGGSFLGGIFGFAEGGIAARGRPVALPRFATGGIARSASIFGEAGPEAAVPLPDGRRIPVDLRTPAAGAGQNRIVIDLNPSEAFVAGVANRQITTAAGQIVEVSVRKSREVNRKALAADSTDSSSRRYG